MSNSDRTRLAYSLESAYGADPSPGGFVPSGSVWDTNQWYIENNVLKRIPREAQNEKQLIKLGSQTSGAYRLRIDDGGTDASSPREESTSPTYQIFPDASDLKAILASLYDVNPDDFNVSGQSTGFWQNSPFLIEFLNSLAEKPLPIMETQNHTLSNPENLLLVERVQFGRPPPGTALIEEVHYVEIRLSFSTINFRLRFYTEFGPVVTTGWMNRDIDSATATSLISAIWPGAEVEAVFTSSPDQIALTITYTETFRSIPVPEIQFEDPLSIGIGQKKSVRLQPGTGNLPYDDPIPCVTGGNFIVMSGWSNPENNVVAYVTAITEDEIALETEFPLVNELPPGTISIECGTFNEGEETFKRLRFTDESLREETRMVDSAELQLKRNIVDIVRTQSSVIGELGIEFSDVTFDEWLTILLCSQELGFEDVFSDDKLGQITPNHIEFDFHSYVVGDWLRIASDPVSGYFRVTEVVGNTVTLSPSFNVTVADVEMSVTLSSNRYNDTTLRTMRIQKTFLDIQQYILYRGVGIDRFELVCKAGSIVTGRFTLLGKNESTLTESLGEGTFGLGGFALLAPIIASDVSVMFEDGEYAPANSVVLQISNNLRGRYEIGELGPSSIGQGKFKVTGAIRVFLEDATLLDKYLAAEWTSIALRIDNYIFEIANIRFTSGRRVAGGQNTEVIADMEFSAALSVDTTLCLRKFTVLS